MMLCNKTSRYDVADIAIRGGAKVNAKVAARAHAVQSYVMHLKEKDRQYIFETGMDPKETFETPVFA